MSNFIYTKGKEALMRAEIDLEGDVIKAVLVDTSLYTSNQTTDDALADIVAGARVETTANLSGRSVAGGVLIADAETMPAVTGASAEALVLYKEGASEATSPLIMYIDTADFLPITPNGGDIIIDWNSGDGRIFSL